MYTVEKLDVNAITALWTCLRSARSLTFLLVSLQTGSITSKTWPNFSIVAVLYRALTLNYFVIYT